MGLEWDGRRIGTPDTGWRIGERHRRWRSPSILFGPINSVWRGAPAPQLPLEIPKAARRGRRPGDGVAVSGPQVELNPETTRARGIAAGDWVRVETSLGSARARAKLNPSLDPQVVCGQHDWWQACPELDLPGYPALGPGSANLNAVLSQEPSDPISGSSPLRASMCNVSLLAPAEEGSDAPAEE